MNVWMTRVLGGAVCTIGALALGMGVAQAAEPSKPRIDAQAVVKVATHLGGHQHSKATEPRRRATANSLTDSGPGKIKTAVRADVHRGNQPRSTTQPATNPIRVDASARHRADTAVKPKITLKPSRLAVSPARHSASPSIKVEQRAKVLTNTTDVCVLINTDGCGADENGSGSTDPARPAVASDMAAAVSDVGDGTVCLRVNGGACSTSADGAGSDLNAPGTPLVDRPSGGGADEGTVSGGLGGHHRGDSTSTFRFGDDLTTPVFDQGQAAPGLPNTGAAPGLLGLLLAGLLALLTGGRLVRVSARRQIR